jgi:hypothetical protein
VISSSFSRANIRTSIFLHHAFEFRSEDKTRLGVSMLHVLNASISSR